ncbi:MAG TPA: TraR/DksA C4-type zinc finger protein [Xanthobacteraceae bacterium]|nr:TraR/DksA C4-type zinc finger protein [Xanthobacteraceae bacterium]
MSDDVDRAQALEERQREISLRRQAERMAGDGRLSCVVCGEAIDPERLRVLPNALRCIGCQERRERWRRGRRRYG